MAQGYLKWRNNGNFTKIYSLASSFFSLGIQHLKISTTKDKGLPKAKEAREGKEHERKKITSLRKKAVTFKHCHVLNAAGHYSFPSH